MNAGEYRTKQMIPGIMMLYGFPEECSIYAVEGEEFLAVIDTGMGKGDLQAALKKFAPEKKIFVFNTHCHFDHSTGNFQFPGVYMHPKCYPDQDETENSGFSGCADFPEQAYSDTCRIPVKEGDTFDLGGVQLEVIETPGHTPGCICLLDRTHRILFAGDLIVTDHHKVWMLKSLPWVDFSTVSIECYLRSLRKLQSMEDRFDGILSGHDDFVLDKRYLQELIDLSSQIIDGTAKAYRPEMLSPPGMPPVDCLQVDGKKINVSILYQNEVIHDKKWEI